MRKKCLDDKLPQIAAEFLRFSTRQHVSASAIIFGPYPRLSKRYKISAAHFMGSQCAKGKKLLIFASSYASY